MSDFLDHLSFNDKDIFDILISGQQKLTERVLQELARDRGIFYSAKESRDDLANLLSRLPHDYHDVNTIVHRRETHSRREKTTFVELDAEISVDEIRGAIAAYELASGVTEKVTHTAVGVSGVSMSIEYDEYNRGRTRLLQKQRHEANMEFHIEGGKTKVRLPATEKAKRVYEFLRENLEKERKQPLKEEEVELTALKTPQERTAFFLGLINKMNGYKLTDVTNLRVSSMQEDEQTLSDEDDPFDIDGDDAEASRRMFAVVHSMALSGKNLVQAEEYQELIKRGFFITSITWRAEQVSTPYDRVEFDAGFQDKSRGSGFKYGVHGAFRCVKGVHRKTIQPVQEIERLTLFKLIESTARDVLADLVKKIDAPDADADGEGSDGSEQP